MRLRILLGARHCLGRQVRQHGIGGGIQHIESRTIPGKLVRIDQPAVGLVKGIGGQMILVIKLTVMVGAKPRTRRCTFSCVGFDPVTA